jgi:hypothetical protein
MVQQYTILFVRNPLYIKERYLRSISDIRMKFSQCPLDRTRKRIPRVVETIHLFVLSMGRVRTNARVDSVS